MSHVEVTPDQWQSVLQDLREKGRIDALITLRRVAGVDLRRATELLDAAIAGARPGDIYGGDNMGMSADVLAIGPYSTAVKQHMEYPAKFYADTRDGAPILRVLFQVFEGSTKSRELAECFGIDAWDFNQHELDPARADLPKLGEMFGEEDVAVFEALRGAGFKFYYRPNG